LQESRGSPKFLDASLFPCQALGPRQTLGNHCHAAALDWGLFSQFSAWFPGGATIFQSWRATYRFLCIDFRHVNNVVICFVLLSRLKLLQGGASPLWPRKYSVYASTLLFTRSRRRIRNNRSVRGARLDRDGWLALIPLGLSPSQKHQAFLAH